MSKKQHPTEEITLNTVFYKIGSLEGIVDGLATQVKSLDDSVKLRVCVKEEELKVIKSEIGRNTASRNQFIGGKAAILFIVLIFISIFATAATLYAQRQTSLEIMELNKKVEEVKSVDIKKVP